MQMRLFEPLNREKQGRVCFLRLVTVCALANTSTSEFCFWEVERVTPLHTVRSYSMHSVSFVVLGRGGCEPALGVVI